MFTIVLQFIRLLIYTSPPFGHDLRATCIRIHKQGTVYSLACRRHITSERAKDAFTPVSKRFINNLSPFGWTVCKQLIILRMAVCKQNISLRVVGKHRLCYVT